MTRSPAYHALEHLAWCRRQGMSWADICTSVNSIGFDEADAFNAVLVAVCETEDVTVRGTVEPPRRLHLRVVSRRSSYEVWRDHRRAEDEAVMRAVSS